MMKQLSTAISGLAKTAVIFWFQYALPNSPEYDEILCRHKLTKTMEANTFEKYPSGKTILSKGGKTLEISLPKSEKTYV